MSAQFANPVSSEIIDSSRITAAAETAALDRLHEGATDEESYSLCPEKGLDKLELNIYNHYEINRNYFLRNS
jgi:hypothetical protein